MLIISDCHLPWAHPKAFEFVKRMRDKLKPDRIISVGDFFDLNSFSRYPANPEMHSPNDEIELAIEAAEEWYDEFDTVDVCESNHDARIIRKASAGGLPSRVLRRFEEIMHAPAGWRWYEGGIEVDGFLIIHGDALNASSSRTAFNRYKCSIAHGHTHSGMAVNYSQSRKERYFSLNTGCLIDPRAEAFGYAKHSLERATLGMGYVVDGDEAMILPMPNKLQKTFS